MLVLVLRCQKLYYHNLNTSKTCFILLALLKFISWTTAIMSVDGAHTNKGKQKQKKSDTIIYWYSINWIHIIIIRYFNKYLLKLIKQNTFMFLKNFNLNLLCAFDLSELFAFFWKKKYYHSHIHIHMYRYVLFIIKICGSNL